MNSEAVSQHIRAEVLAELELVIRNTAGPTVADEFMVEFMTLWRVATSGELLQMENERHLLPLRLRSGSAPTRFLRRHVLEHRSELVAAALTILRAYVVAGRPFQDLATFGTCGSWSDLIRRAIVWSWEPDPVDWRDAQPRGSGPTTESRSPTRRR